MANSVPTSEVGTGWKSRNGFEVYGRDGITIGDKWKDGVATFHGIHMNGFPNYFVYQNAQAGAAVNFPRVYDDQSLVAVYCIKQALDNNWETLEVTKETEDAWVEESISKSMMRKKFQQECTPGGLGLAYGSELIRLTSLPAPPLTFLRLLQLGQVV